MIKSKKLIGLVLLLVVSMILAACFTIRVGGKAELAPSTEEGTKIAQKRCWYAVWGLVPLGDNSTDPLIPGTVKKVRVETKYTVPDFLINIFTGLVTIETFTVEIYEVK
jgi:predicted small secreted protein